MNTQSFQNWESRLYGVICEIGEMSNGDAKALVEAQGGKIQALFDAGKTPQEAAAILLQKAKSIDDYGWEELHSFHMQMYPDDLILTTPASESQVKELWEEFIEKEWPDQNFDQFITDKTGLPAISSCLNRDLALIL